MDDKKLTYTFDEAFKASVDYFGGDELAAKVWVNKYAVKDSSQARHVVQMQFLRISSQSIMP